MDPNDKYSWHFRPEQMIRLSFEEILRKLTKIQNDIDELKLDKKL